MQVRNLIIIGGGCAGLTAGIYAGRAELKPLLFAGKLDEKGGLLTKTSVVENYPGFEEGVNGYDLMQSMELQAIRCGTEVINRKIVSLEKKGNIFSCIDDNAVEYQANAVIIATGSEPNKLKLPDENTYWGKGISSCAVCDGALYKRKKIIVVGGGDSAMEEALFLTKFSNVTLVHRRDSFRASAVMQQRVLNNPKINILYNSAITRLIGDGNNITHVNITTTTNHGDDNPTVTTTEVDGLFYGLGLTPNIELLKNFPDVKIVHGHATTFRGTTLTPVNGLFLAGDVCDDRYRQAVVAAAEGCKAAMDAIEYLN